MKRAIVLSGGGTKGAYELGVWKALREKETEFHIVTGTSIGAINGAMMCTGDYEKCCNMWENMVMEDLMNDGITVTNTMEDFYNNKKPLGPFLRKYFKRGGIDNSPFTDFVRKNISEEKVRSSKVEYGLVTVKQKGLFPCCLSRQEIPQGKLKDFVIASSSIYPVFPIHEIDGEPYLDGCYYDNLPIDLAFRLGATDVIAVDMHTLPQHPNYADRPYVTYLTPSRELGGVLDFDPERIKSNIRAGYRDAMRKFGKYKGFTYSFYPESLKKYRRSAERFCLMIARSEAVIMERDTSKLEKAGDLHRIFQLFQKGTGRKELKKEDYFLRAAELCGEVYEISPEEIYDMSDYVRRLLSRIKTVDAYPDAGIFANISQRGIIKRLMDLKLQNEVEYLTGCLYYALRSDTLSLNDRAQILALLPQETAAAMFLTAL